MPKLVKSIIGRIHGSPEGVDPFVFNCIREALGPLDKIEGGLGKRAAAYVCTGDGSAILLTLQKQAGNVVEHLNFNGYWYGGSGKKNWPLGPILDQENFWDPSLVLRLGYVYGTAEPILAGATYGFCGTKAAPMWLRLLLTVTERARNHAHDYSEQAIRPFGHFTVARCRELLRLAEEPDDGLLDILFHRSATEYMKGDCVDKLPGVADYLEAKPETVVAAAQALNAQGRVQLIRTIGRLGLTDAYLGYVFAQGTGSAKSAREAALAALHGAGAEKLLAQTAEIFGSGSPGARGHAASLIASVLKEEARPLLETQLETEKGKRVRETIESALTTLSLTSDDAARPGDGSAGAEAEPDMVGGQERPPPANGGFIALDGSAVDLPPSPPLPEKTRVPDHLYDGVWRSIESYNAALDAVKRANAKEKHHWSRYWNPMTKEDLIGFRRLLEGDGEPKTTGRSDPFLSALDHSHHSINYDRSGIEAFFASPEVTVWHLLGLVRTPYLGLFFVFAYAHGQLSIAALKRRLQDGFDFRLLAKMYIARGGGEQLRDFLSSEYLRELDEATFADLWIYCAEHLDLIDEALGISPQSGDKPLIPLAALEILARFPKVPKRYLMPLIGLATGSRKTLREPARKLLAGAPQIDNAIAALLKDGKQEVRAGAADWLGDRGAKGQITALKAAVDKERSEIARAAMLTALDRLGDDVSVYFDPETLLAEAEAGLKKAKLKNLDWFPHDAVPAVKWRDGAALDPKVVAWWIALADKLKQPGGNALFDLYLDRLAPEDSERLGLFILRAWIGHDTVRPSEADANQYARANVDSQFTSMVRWMPDLTKDAVFAQLKSAMMGEYLNSANANKGLLGLAARAPGPDAAEAGRAYLKNHGARVAQCKALLECLAANPAPAAIQVVLATANRFKAKTVQAHAQALIEDIAERRGWTAEQLADRTIPTAGLDETGVLELDCGTERVYRAKLAEDGKLVLENPSGKEVKSLPGARNEDEQGLINAAKKTLSSARKEIKQVDAMQANRLAEALCVERVWAPDEWRQYLNRHPIVGRMCQRLVWLGLAQDGAIAASFRPLEDGSLSDPRDETVALDGLAEIKLAHQTLVAETTKDAWLTHLKDYEVEPLFDQFSRPLLKPGDDEAASDEVGDRRGHMLESFKLRGAATKLGYQRGEAMDGGVFTDYVKRYQGVGIAVVIEFTGSPLPEENIACALLSLKFYRIRKKASYWDSALPLGEVPPVLLSESWNDYRQIAAVGAGFDPDWEKKAECW